MISNSEQPTPSTTPSEKNSEKLSQQEKEAALDQVAQMLADSPQPPEPQTRDEEILSRLD